MKKRQTELKSEIKILLLGTGESGKSTIYKQIKILHKNGFSEPEARLVKGFVYANMIISMVKLVKGAQKLGLNFTDENLDRANSFSELTEHSVITKVTSDEAWFREVGCPDMMELWKEEAIQYVFQRKSEFHVYDGFGHFITQIERISQPSYLPTQEDILFTRVKTTGVSEIEFQVNNVKFRVIDVGGQRSERRKWIHQFEGVTAVLFVVSLSEYDQLCFEDDKTNRMHESLKLFEETCNHPTFTDKPIILFLNKTDLFEQKLSAKPLGSLFPEYTGGADAELAKGFIRDKFVSHAVNRDVYPHFTCATDTQQVQAVLNSVQEIIVKAKNDPRRML